MTDERKEALRPKDGGAGKPAAEGDRGSCCSSSCCGTAEADTADPVG